MTESGRARLWAAVLSVVAMGASALVVVINPLEVALAYLTLLTAVIAVGLMTSGWGGLMASVIGAFALVLFNQYAGIYPRESRIINIASELVAFLLAGPAAGRLGVAVERIQRQADHWLALTEDRTVHDETFGTLKPRWAQVRLQEEVLRAASFARPLAVALLHLEPSPQAAVERRADRVAALQAVVRLARSATRPPSVVAHAGGDQVLIILPEHTPEQAQELVAGLQCRTAQALYFPDGGGPSLGKPLSEWGKVRIGLASFDGQAATSESLMAQAQANLR